MPPATRAVAQDTYSRQALHSRARQRQLAWLRIALFPLKEVLLMRRTWFPATLLILGLVLLPPRTAQAQQAEMIAAGPESASFVPVPGLPAGSDFYVVNGSPEEAFEMYFRLQPGVRVPMHFHTSPERAVGVQAQHLVPRFKDGPGGGATTYVFTETQSCSRVAPPEVVQWPRRPPIAAGWLR